MAAYNFIDITGQTFSRWTVIKRVDNENRKNAKWLCRCECGTEKCIPGIRLRSGNSMSCGCLQKEIVRKNITHGKHKYPEYIHWLAMKQRCYNTNNLNYETYGGRGISICDKWKNDFECFYNDMGKRPSPRHSIERIDVNGNYELVNCKWATVEEQARNRRIKSTNTTGHTGVHFRKNIKRYYAYISVNKKLIGLGSYNTIEEAINVRKEAEILYWSKPS